MKIKFSTKCFYILILLTMVFAACNKPANTQNNNARVDSSHFNDTLSIVQENPKITEYRIFTHQLDSTDANSSLKALSRFTEVFKDQSKNLCDSAFVIYQSLYDTIELKLNEKIQNDTTNFEALWTGEKVSKQIKTLQNTLKQSGFRLTTSEGIAYIEQDRSFISKNFYPMISDSMKVYLNEIQTENKEGFASELSITISPQQLVNRILWYERFIAGNPKFVFRNKCIDFRKAYLTYLVDGYKNTTIYSGNETKDLSAYFQSAYEYLFSKFPQSETATLLQPYYQALKQKQTGTVKELHKNYIIKGLIYNLNS